jgi:hypothetical protein
MRRDGGRLQVFRECGHYLGRHRTCPSDTQETILVRARSISKLWVTKANLGSSARVALRLGACRRMCRPDQIFARKPQLRAPLMHQFQSRVTCAPGFIAAMDTDAAREVCRAAREQWTRRPAPVIDAAPNSDSVGVHVRHRRGPPGLHAKMRDLPDPKMCSTTRVVLTSPRNVLNQIVFDLVTGKCCTAF